MSKDPMSDMGPRVAKLESAVEMIGRELSDFIKVSRDNQSDTNRQIAALATATERAGAPRATNWQTLFAGLAFVISIGAGIWLVLQERIDRNREDTLAVERRDRVSYDDQREQINKLHNSLVDHEKQIAHPVGLAEIINLKKNVDALNLLVKDESARLDSKLQREFSLVNDSVKITTADLDTRIQREFGLTKERDESRFNKLEFRQLEQIKRDEDELQVWRMKAMNAEKGKTQ